MLDLLLQDDKESMYNTPPVFPIYVSMLTMEWMKAQGGVKEMERRNEAKAKLLYDEVDRNPLFKGTTAVEDRSLMNPTFILNDVESGWCERNSWPPIGRRIQGFYVQCLTD
jgi:phosphoserine aminotransferase